MKKALSLLILFLCTAVFAGTGLKKDEVIEFYPSAAVISSDGSITAEIRGRVVEKEGHALKDKLKGELRSSLGLTEDSDEDDLLKERMKKIFADGESGRIVTVKFMGKTFSMSRSSSGGYFSGTVSGMVRGNSGSAPSCRVIQYESVPGEKNKRIFSGTVTAVSAEGISVISDIDDTVKISNVADKKELMKNTFFRVYRSVPGMSDLYRSWAGRGAAVHYVSGSPRQMHGLLAEFFAAEGFPCSELCLKAADISDGSISSFLKADQFGYKTGEIRSIMRHFPQRRFILLGDSGEKDPEVYAVIASEFPGRIAAVCIRDVSSEGETSKRIASLKKGKERWIIFKDGKDLAKEKLP